MNKKIIFMIVASVSVCCIVSFLLIAVLTFSTIGNLDNTSIDGNQNTFNNDNTTIYNDNNEINTDNEVKYLPLPTRSSKTCSIISQNSLPANWPSDFTLYPGSKVTSVKCAPNTADLYEVRAVTDDSVDIVSNYFSKIVEENNWSKTTMTDNDLYETFTAYKLLNTYKDHENSSRQMILDIRSYIDKSRVSGETEIIYREREW